MIKNEIRKKYKTVRQNIPVKRRKFAENRAFRYLSLKLGALPNILSYASCRDEFSTFKINKFLARNSSLILPKTTEEGLKIFRVKNFDKDLEVNSYGILEPKPTSCEEVHFNELSFILVPGIAFDQLNNRLGYGKGYYDCFLSKLTHFKNVFGLAFREQMSLDTFPMEKHDIPLIGVLIF